MPRQCQAPGHQQEWYQDSLCRIFHCPQRRVRFTEHLIRIFKKWSHFSMQEHSHVKWEWSYVILTNLTQQNGYHFSNIFKCIFLKLNVLYFDSKFTEFLFLSIWLSVSQHWFREWLCAQQAISNYLNEWWPSLLMHIYASLSFNELMKQVWFCCALCCHGDIMNPLWIHVIYSPIFLTHWGQVTHICVNKLTIIGSNNGLSPGRRQAIT